MHLLVRKEAKIVRCVELFLSAARNKAMFTTYRSAVSILNNLLECCRLSESGYRIAYALTNNRDLKKIFKSFMDQRALFALNLEAHINRLGGLSESDLAFPFFKNRWDNIKEIITAKDDTAIIEVCDRAEESIRKAYDEALGEGLAGESLNEVREQFEVLKQSSGLISAIKVTSQWNIP